MPEHNVLTGASLHESKGVDAAAANRVYVSDGAGSGSWTTVGLSALASTAKAFETQLLHIQDQKAQNTAGGTFTSGDWRVRDLNTVLINEITSASLASNQISLPAGTYIIDASAPANARGEHQTRLWNATDASTIKVGTTERCITGSDTMSRSFIFYKFTIAGTKLIELQHRTGNTKATDGLGLAANFATEVYSDVRIWKVA